MSISIATVRDSGSAEYVGNCREPDWETALPYGNLLKTLI